MKFDRRQFLSLAGAGLAAPILSHSAVAQAYPTRPVRIIVGNAAGGGPDIVARLLGPGLSERLGQPVIIENRPGGGGNIAAEMVVNAPADGHTILLATIGHAVNAAFYEKLNYNFVRDITPVASISRDPLFMLVHPSSPAKTVPQFIAYAKTNRGRISMASPGSGTAPHIAGELFKMMAGIDMVHVPYRSGAPALTDLISGQVQVYFGALPVSIEHIRAGKLLPLAVTSATRLDVLPAVPAMSDTVPGYEASTWFGIGAPRNTPLEIAGRLNQEINAGLGDPGLKARFADLGSSTFVGSPSDFGKFVVEEADKWAKVVKFAGIKPE